MATLKERITHRRKRVCRLYFSLIERYCFFRICTVTISKNPECKGNSRITIYDKKKHSLHKFRNVFGVTPHKWMMEKKANITLNK
jgi:hypothetical protein